MIRKAVLTLAVIALGLSASAQCWHRDVACDGFEMRYIQQPDDYDGPVRCTLVRLLAPESRGRAVVYVHGFNDYFFQSEMAHEFVDHGYNFYALDLRKYGRSIMPSQRKFDVRSLNEYFPDIDSALTAARHDGNYELILVGHSTGGLLTSYYMAKNPAAPVDAMVLNSPFLDWNLGWKEFLVPLVSAVGAVFPDIPVSQGDSDAYSQSLLKSRHGEWTYNLDWKLPESPDVTAGWVHAINTAQSYLHHHKYSINIPILLMFSAASSSSESWCLEASRSDVVLDVNDIHRYGMTLGHRVKPVVVKDGLHDLMLSQRAVRVKIYEYMFQWLEDVK